VKDSKLVYSTETGDARKAEPKGELPGAGGASKTQGQVTVRLDTKGRKGKPMTVVSGIQHNPQVIAELARQLRNLCGAGGTVEGKDILVQGDHREKIAVKLGALQYKVKRV